MKQKCSQGFKDAIEISRTFIISGLEIEFSWYHDANSVTLTYILVELDKGFYQCNDPAAS